MVGLRSAVPLLAAACSAVVSASVVPGAFIFEFEENQVSPPNQQTRRHDV